MSDRPPKDELLLTQILETPSGIMVRDTFVLTLVNTMDPLKALEEAEKVAKNQGTLTVYQIAILLDALRVLGPIAKYVFEEWRKKKRD